MFVPVPCGLAISNVYSPGEIEAVIMWTDLVVCLSYLIRIHLKTVITIGNWLYLLKSIITSYSAQTSQLCIVQIFYLPCTHDLYEVLTLIIFILVKFPCSNQSSFLLFLSKTVACILCHLFRYFKILSLQFISILSRHRKVKNIFISLIFLCVECKEQICVFYLFFVICVVCDYPSSVDFLCIEVSLLSTMGKIFYMYHPPPHNREGGFDVSY